MGHAAMDAHALNTLPRSLQDHQLLSLVNENWQPSRSRTEKSPVAAAIF
jgi:hypothetical protein